MVTVIVPWKFESVGFKLSMNPHVPSRLAMVAINSSPGRSVGLFSSGQSACWGSGLEASWWGALSMLTMVIELFPETELSFGLTPALLSVRVRADEA